MTLSREVVRTMNWDFMRGSNSFFSSFSRSLCSSDFLLMFPLRKEAIRCFGENVKTAPSLTVTEVIFPLPEQRQLKK